MRDVPPTIDESFYAGRRTLNVPFVVNDSVEILAEPYKGQLGAVISLEAVAPQVLFLVELGSTGAPVVANADQLRLI